MGGRFNRTAMADVPSTLENIGLGELLNRGYPDFVHEATIKQLKTPRYGLNISHRNAFKNFGALEFVGIP